MLAKLIAHASTRDEAIERLREALKELKVEGVPTTAPLHDVLLDSASFRSGDYSTASMSEVMSAYAAEASTESEPAKDATRGGADHG
jgi:acetyl-CoA carboxylase biotin carboxylase subunit